MDATVLYEEVLPSGKLISLNEKIEKMKTQPLSVLIMERRKQLHDKKVRKRNGYDKVLNNRASAPRSHSILVSKRIQKSRQLRVYMAENRMRRADQEKRLQQHKVQLAGRVEHRKKMEAERQARQDQLCEISRMIFLSFAVSEWNKRWMHALALKDLENRNNAAIILCRFCKGWKTRNMWLLLQNLKSNAPAPPADQAVVEAVVAARLLITFLRGMRKQKFRMVIYYYIYMFEIL